MRNTQAHVGTPVATSPPLFDPLRARSSMDPIDKQRLLRIQFHAEALVNLIDLSHTVGHEIEVSSAVDGPARMGIISI